MCLCVVHELGEVGVLAFLCLLGRGDDVDGVDQLCNGAQLFLEIHGQDLLQVQHDVGLGAQNVSITVSGLLAGKVDAVCAACTFDVDDLNRNTQDGLQHGLQGAQGAVSTAADAQGQTSVTLRSQVQSEAAADAAAEPAVDEAAVDEPEPPQAARPRAAAETPAAFRKLRRVIIFS